MNTTQVSGSPMLFGDALVTAVMGYAIVFLGIVLLMAVVVIMGKIMTARKAPAAPEVPSHKAPEAPAPQAKKDLPAAPGSAGELKLYDTDPKTAAMLMAIVADKMGKPLNELRFKSIREIKEDK